MNLNYNPCKIKCKIIMIKSLDHSVSYMIYNPPPPSSRFFVLFLFVYFLFVCFVCFVFVLFYFVVVLVFVLICCL